MHPVRAVAAGVRLEIRVIPRSPRTKVDGVRDGRIVLRVTAAPVDQEANDAVVQALSTLFRVPRRDVRIVAGLTSRNKSIEIDGLSPAQVRASVDVGAL